MKIITLDALILLLLIIVSTLIGLAMIVMSTWMGRRKGTPAKLQPFESGMPLLDRSHKRISIKYFVIALLFLVFDVEVAFLYPWILIAREGKAFMWGEVGLFFLLIFVVYLYLVKEKAFLWNP